jgi:hypothetical protein
MSNAFVPEPSIAEVLAKLHLMDIETRTRDAEFRSSLSELRLDMDIRFSDIFRRLDSLFAELVAFRAEYNQHTHDG